MMMVLQARQWQTIVAAASAAASAEQQWQHGRNAGSHEVVVRTDKGERKGKEDNLLILQPSSLQQLVAHLCCRCCHCCSSSVSSAAAWS